MHRFVPRYFKKDILKGFAELTVEGWKAFQEEIEEDMPACICHIIPGKFQLGFFSYNVSYNIFSKMLQFSPDVQGLDCSDH